jgi:hypothetical protein
VQHFKALADDTDDTDDKITLFSKEREKFKIGELVKPSEPHHERGQNLGIVQAGDSPIDLSLGAEPTVN